MKIAKCHDGTDEFWAVVEPEAGVAKPISGSMSDWAPALTADPGSPPPFAGGERSLDSLRLLAPVESTATVICAGATYAKHIDGLGLKMPKKPAAFVKTYRSLIGPYDEIEYPAITDQLDYEVELVAIVGAERIEDPKSAIKAVLGYAAGNDVSARDHQFAESVTGMDMFSAKVLDRTSAVGPWIVTRDEFGDEHPDLELRLTVDGELRQNDRTKSMVWGVGELLDYVDARTRLLCGDVLFTGTPAGVGHEDGRYLEPGHVVEASLERIGSVRNTVGKRPAVRR